MNLCSHEESYATVTGHAYKQYFKVCKNCYDIIEKDIQEMLKLKKELEKWNPILSVSGVVNLLMVGLIAISVK